MSTPVYSTVLLHEYRQRMGYELYVPASTKNSIEATIEAVPVGNQDRTMRP